MSRVYFVVHGLPAPQGSKSFKGFSKAGKAILTESSKAVKPWREAVKFSALEARASVGNPPPLDGPLYLSVRFFLPKPTSAPKRTRTFPHRKPDLSKLVRSTEDALVDAGLIADDARIIAIEAYKDYVGHGKDSPGAVIEVATWP